MSDRQIRIGSSLVQHGEESDRVYLMELDRRDMPDLVHRLDDLAHRWGYGKIFAKVPRSCRREFRDHGYETEALVPGFFSGREAGHFMCKYLDPTRAEPRHAGKIAKVLQVAKARARARARQAAPDDIVLERCTPEHAEVMARVYREVFPSYPFPIHQPEFLLETMDSHVTYFAAWRDDELVALSSAEKYLEGGHAEMTDFATIPERRGEGLASALLSRAEDHVRRRGFAVAYTIARALSFGMNITFARSGYRFAGTLVNNTQISGRIESMNVWYKDLRSGAPHSPRGVFV